MSRPGKNQGAKNFKAKLKDEDVVYIFMSEDKTQQELASKFGVTQSTINHIKSGRTWSWLTKSLR